MERIGSKTVWQGKVGSVRIDEFRHPDGSTSVREVIGHPGAVAMVAHDERFLYLVRQPREAVGEGTAGQSGPHDQDSAHARNATGHARRPHEVRSATMTL